LEIEEYDLMDSIIISKATELARDQRYDEAEGLLKHIIQDYEPSARALDLLGKIYAQQGKILEARSAWKLALQIDPNNHDYVNAMKKCESVLVPDYRGRALYYLIILILLIFMIVYFIIFRF